MRVLSILTFSGFAAHEFFRENRPFLRVAQYDSYDPTRRVHFRDGREDYDAEADRYASYNMDPFDPPEDDYDREGYRSMGFRSAPRDDPSSGWSADKSRDKWYRRAAHLERARANARVGSDGSRARADYVRTPAAFGDSDYFTEGPGARAPLPPPARGHRDWGGYDRPARGAALQRAEAEDLDEGGQRREAEYPYTSDVTVKDVMSKAHLALEDERDNYEVVLCSVKEVKEVKIGDARLGFSVREEHGISFSDTGSLARCTDGLGMTQMTSTLHDSNPCFGILRMSEKQFDSRLCNFSSHDEDAEKWSIGDVQNPAGKLVDVIWNWQCIKWPNRKEHIKHFWFSTEKREEEGPRVVMMVVPKDMYNKVENDCQPACLHKEAVLEFKPEPFYELVHDYTLEQIAEPLFFGKQTTIPAQRNHGRLTFALVSSMIDDGGEKSRSCSDLSGYLTLDAAQATMRQEAREAVNNHINNLTVQKPALSVAQLAAQPPAVTAAVAAQPAVAQPASAQPPAAQLPAAQLPAAQLLAAQPAQLAAAPPAAGPAAMPMATVPSPMQPSAAQPAPGTLAALEAKAKTAENELALSERIADAGKAASTAEAARADRAELELQAEKNKVAVVQSATAQETARASAAEAALAKQQQEAQTAKADAAAEELRAKNAEAALLLQQKQAEEARAAAAAEADRASKAEQKFALEKRAEAAQEASTAAAAQAKHLEDELSAQERQAEREKAAAAVVAEKAAKEAEAVAVERRKEAAQALAQAASASPAAGAATVQSDPASALPSLPPLDFHFAPDPFAGAPAKPIVDLTPATLAPVSFVIQDDPFLSKTR